MMALAAPLLGLVGKLLEALVGPLFEQWRRWQEQRTARNLGRQEQRGADLQAGMDEARKANEARSGGRSDADLDRLLK